MSGSRTWAILLCISTGCVSSPCAGAEDELRRLYVFSGRPLAEAARAIAQVFGQPVAFEEAAYTDEHPVRPIFPGSTMIPEAVRLDVTYEHALGVKVALQRAVSAATETIPERYRIVESQGVFGIVPNTVGLGPSEISPMELGVVLPDEAISTEQAVYDMVSQLNSVLPRAKLEVSLMPNNLANRTKLQSNHSGSARDLMNTVMARWSAELARPDQIPIWTIRYGPEISTPEQRVFLLTFSLLTTVYERQNNQLVVESEHPLADAAAILEDHFRAAIVLEEPPVTCDCDLVGHIGTENIALAGGILRYQWSDEDKTEDVIAGLLSHYAVSHRVFASSVFDVDWHEQRPILKPQQMKSSESTYDEYEPLLDAKLGASAERINAKVSLEEIAEGISSASGRRVIAGEEDTRANNVDSERLGLAQPVDHDTTVQELLLRLRDSTSSVMSFHLLYDPVLEGHRLVARTVRRKNGA